MGTLIIGTFPSFRVADDPGVIEWSRDIRLDRTGRLSPTLAWSRHAAKAFQEAMFAQVPLAVSIEVGKWALARDCTRVREATRPF